MDTIARGALTTTLFLLAASAVSAAEPAIGRLNYAGHRQQQYCSATLIGEQIALTAAHCVDKIDASEMHLLLGYERGEWLEQARLTTNTQRLPRRDAALLCLQRPANTSPLPLSRIAPYLGEQLVVIGYPIPAMHLQNRSVCQVDRVNPNGNFLLSCPTKPGASGGPVLRASSNGLEVVGVISATTSTHSLAFSVVGEQPLACK